MAVKEHQISDSLRRAIGDLEETLQAAKAGDVTAVAKIERYLHDEILTYTYTVGTGGNALRINSHQFVSHSLHKQHGLVVFDRSDWQIGGGSPVWKAIDALTDCRMDDLDRAALTERALKRFEWQHRDADIESRVLDFFRSNLGDKASTYFRSENRIH